MMKDYPSYLLRLLQGEKVNPFLDFLQVEIRELGEGKAVFSMPIRRAYLQGAGYVQGGIMVALADETIAHAVMTRLTVGEGLMTLELKSDFLAPVKEGNLIAHAQVFKKGRTIAIGDCLVKDEDERNLLRVTATFMIFRAE
ncbi:MAG: PaaI family thioesterase [Syntrophales bacterium]|nr:PaaI family thioesterase [Syntrophales bacterium]